MRVQKATAVAQFKVFALLSVIAFCLLVVPSVSIASIVVPSNLDPLTLDPMESGGSSTKVGTPLTVEQLDKMLEKLSVDPKAKSTLAVSNEGSGAGSSQARTTTEWPSYAAEGQPLDWPYRQGQEPPRQYATLSLDGPINGGSTGSTSSSTSVGGTGGIGSALLSPTTAHLADDSPAERHATERTLFLPDAPGTELLRPPRG